MKITIDTKEDSHHEIKKVIHLLNLLVGSESSELNSIPSQNSSEVEYPQVADVFSSSPSVNSNDDLPNVGDFMNSVSDNETDDDKKDESSEIVMY